MRRSPWRCWARSEGCIAGTPFPGRRLRGARGCRAPSQEITEGARWLCRAHRRMAKTFLAELKAEGDTSGYTVLTDFIRDWRERVGAHAPTRQRSGRAVGDVYDYVVFVNREFAPRLNREHSEFRWFKPKQLPSRFNAPTWVAIKKGLLEKVARH